jgi:flavin-binding protein dodecin
MAGQVYKQIDLVGSSPESLTDAIEGAVNRAAETIKGLDWFEVKEIRGQIVDGHVAHYQVAVRIGFRVMSPEDLERG